MTPFTNNARSDGLVLRHWQRLEEPARPALRDVPDANANEEKDKKERLEGAAEANEDGEVKPLEQEYAFAKYNIKAKVPHRYSDEEYNKYLQSADWSREETDYLMDIVQDYDLRWIIIADRYDYQPPLENAENNAAALVPAGKRYRTMEQMKARYYYVTASMLALEHPPSEMSGTEFDLHEKMLKFDPERERARKELSALQLSRTADEVREEGILLEELKRITANEQNFITDRRELYARLEVPISVGNTTMYQSSQGLSQLLHTLLQADKSKKRRSLLGPEGVASPAIPTPAHAHHPSHAQPDTPTTTTAAAAPPAPSTSKKSSSSAAAAAAAASAKQEAQQHTVRTLSPAEEAKYGVSHHDRLAPGVQFRSDRAQKLTQAKSNVQTQKLAGALAELEVPLRLVMPTEPVCKVFEQLIHQVNLLLDARKMSEKIESEIRVLGAAKAERERKEREAKEKENKHDNSDTGVNNADAHVNSDSSVPPPPPPAAGAGNADNAEPRDNKTEKNPSVETAGHVHDPAASASTNADNGNAAAAPSTPVKDRDGAQKRSASVLSNTSNKSAKRQKA